ncbi:MAG: class I SAM-dependent methyltransferase [Cyanobacteria bacterium P01_H01_bin.15]
MASRESLLLAKLLESQRQSPKQRLTFAEFMSVVLYDAEAGYYGSGQVTIGAQGDFFTSSSLGSDFGELLAAQFAEMWNRLAQPPTFTVVEIGAGTGLFARDVLKWVQQNSPIFAKSLDYVIVDTSPALCVRQAETLSAQPVRWSHWSEIPNNSLVGCVFANEVVDALPVHRVVMNGGKLQEIFVQLTAPRRFEEMQGQLTAKVQEHLAVCKLEFNPQNYAANYRTEINCAIADWLKTIANKLAQGWLLTIDYGYESKRYYAPTRSEGTLQCYLHHQRHSNPYINLGEQDITAHVDFTALQRWGEKAGLQTLGFTRQALFLMALGLGERLEKLRTQGLDLQTTLRRRDALHQWLDPAGLGNFGVLLQGKNLPEATQLLTGFTTPLIS